MNLKFVFCLIMTFGSVISCSADVQDDALTTVSRALEQFRLKQNATAARLSIQAVESGLALNAFKEITQTSPTLFEDRVVLFYSVDEMIRHGGAKDPDIVSFLKQYENNREVGPAIKEALYGVIQGTAPEDAAGAPEILKSSSSSNLEKAQALAQMQYHPELIKRNLGIVRNIAIKGPSNEVIQRQSAVAGLVNAKDFEFLIQEYSKTDPLGKRAIVKECARYVMAKGFPPDSITSQERVWLSALFQKSALEQGDTQRQEAATRALAYLVSQTGLETSRPEDVNSSIVATLKKIRSDSESTQSRKMSDIIIQKLPK